MAHSGRPQSTKSIAAGTAHDSSSLRTDPSGHFSHCCREIFRLADFGEAHVGFIVAQRNGLPRIHPPVRVFQKYFTNTYFRQFHVQLEKWALMLRFSTATEHTAKCIQTTTSHFRPDETVRRDNSGNHVVHTPAAGPPSPPGVVLGLCSNYAKRRFDQESSREIE
jgi:hypothetical protein